MTVYGVASGPLLAEQFAALLGAGAQRAVACPPGELESTLAPMVSAGDVLLVADSSAGLTDPVFSAALRCAADSLGVQLRRVRAGL